MASANDGSVGVTLNMGCLKFSAAARITATAMDTDKNAAATSSGSIAAVAAAVPMPYDSSPAAAWPSVIPRRIPVATGAASAEVVVANSAQVMTAESPHATGSTAPQRCPRSLRWQRA